MSKKLGYTFYPQDWQTDSKVFDLSMEERFIYREFIDRAYVMDNKVPYVSKMFCRLWGTNARKMKKICETLEGKGLIVFDKFGETFSIPSVEKRIYGKRNGKLGGEAKNKGLPDELPKGLPDELPKENRIVNKNNKSIPTFNEFKIYALSKKPSVNLSDLELKYQSWIENNWSNGNDRKIKNWKTSLLNTLPFINETKNKKQMIK